jgi:hypothetical protein
MAQIIVKRALYHGQGMPPEGKVLMATDDPIRASDVDREAVVATLRDAYSAGRLTWDEFDERMTAAYAARTWGDLRPLTADLPVQPVLGSDLPDRLRPNGVPRQYGPPGQLPAQGTRRLPAHRADPRPDEDEDPAGPPARRRRPAAFIVPVAFWALMVLHADPSGGIAALVVIVFLIAAFATAAFRR